MTQKWRPENSFIGSRLFGSLQSQKCVSSRDNNPNYPFLHLTSHKQHTYYPMFLNCGWQDERNVGGKYHEWLFSVFCQSYVVRIFKFFFILFSSVFCNLLPIFGNLVIIRIDYKMLYVSSVYVSSF